MVYTKQLSLPVLAGLLLLALPACQDFPLPPLPLQSSPAAALKATGVELTADELRSLHACLQNGPCAENPPQPPYHAASGKTCRLLPLHRPGAPLSLIACRGEEAAWSVRPSLLQSSAAPP